MTKQEDLSLAAAHRRPFDERFDAGKQLRSVVSREKSRGVHGERSRSRRHFRRNQQGPAAEPHTDPPTAHVAVALRVSARRRRSDGVRSRGTIQPRHQAAGLRRLPFDEFRRLFSPEGNALFDINDFDKSLPDVDFTADLKRLAASFAVAALAAGDGDKSARRIAKNVALAYRERMSKLARLSPLEAWHSRINLTQEGDGLFDGGLAKKLRLAAAQKHADRQEDANFPHIARDAATGARRIKDNPPLIYHVPDKEDPSIHVDIPTVFAGVVDTLAPEIATLLARYKLADSAFKVVGVGSVGTYCAIGLFETTDGDPLFLQIKEALPSALERLQVKPWQGQQGARVVSGQRIMQAATDLFLGWTTDPASGRQFYVRHLKNRRLGSISELLETKALPQYATLCGRTLARAHARSADAATIWGYMGRSEVFADAIASFAMLYAAQNKKDFAAFVAAEGGTASPGQARAARPA